MSTTKKYLNFGWTVCLAGSLLLGACNEQVAQTSPAADSVSSAASLKIAYVNLDTLESNYEYFKTKKIEFEKRQQSMQNEVERLARNFQQELTAFQKKVQAGSLTQTEGEAAQKRLAGMQENLERRQQSLGQQLMTEQEAFNLDLQKRLDDFISVFNKDKGYDFILSYVKGGNILFANPNLDITQEVISGMNEMDKGAKNSKVDTSK